MRHITVTLLAFASFTAASAPLDLQRKLPNDLDAALELIDAVKYDLDGSDFGSAAGFQLRAMWCKKAGRLIHQGLTIREALDRDERLERSGGDLMKKADINDRADVARVCGQPRHGT